MSALELLRIFPILRKALLTTVGGIDPSDSNIITFNPTSSPFYLSHQISFQIIVHVFTQNQKFTKHKQKIYTTETYVALDQ